MADKLYTAKQIDAKLNVLRNDLLARIDSTVVTARNTNDIITKSNGRSLILDVLKVEKEKVKRGVS